MIHAAAPRVFVSATTRDLGEHRRRVTESLNRAGCHVEVQEDFTAHGGKFLQKLRDYIASCDLVVCLVGDHFGWQPPDAALIPSPARDRYPEPLVSATEWEYFLADDCGCDVFLYLSEPGFTPATPSDDTPEKAAAHQRFREHLRNSGRDCNRFSDPATLAQNVLEAFHLRALRKTSQTRPRVLPKAAEHFTGRIEDVDWLETQLRTERRIALIGPGGIGKTAIAHQAIGALSPADDPFAVFPGGIVAHDFYAAPSHHAAIEDLVAQAGLAELDDAEREPRARALLAGARALVYLEGCEKAEELGRFLDLCGPATVLITSRNPNDAKGAVSRTIKPLAEGEAASMLRRHAVAAAPDAGTVRPEDEFIWRDIARLLGRHPLALRLAGFRLGSGNETPTEFHQLLKDEGFEHFDDDHRSKESLDLLFTHSAEALTPPARAGWFALALHALAPIHLAPIAAALRQDEKATRKALNELVRHSLADATRMASDVEGDTEPAWSLSHALLPEWGRKELARFEVEVDSIWERWRQWWSTYLEGAYRTARPPGGPARYTAISEHLDALIANVPARAGADGEVLAVVLNNVGVTHQNMGRYAAAESCFRRDLEISTRLFGPEDLRTVATLHNIAQVLGDQGKFAEAEPHLRHVVEIRERVLGPDAPETLDGVSSLASLLRQRGDLDGARPLYERALQGRERTLGPEHPDTVNSANSLAILLANEGLPFMAAPLFRSVLEVRERTLGREHRDTLMSVNNLATALRTLGDLSGAEPLFRRTIDGMERTLGPEHPDTLMALNNFAIFLYTRRVFGEAEALFRRVLAVRERTLGALHPETLNVVKNLAVLLDDIGDVAAAEPLALRALEGLTTQLLPDHPWRRQAEALLARIHARLGP
jgi:tetratricopeptide (TPR) repeat protein